MGNESETTIVDGKQPIIIEENGNEKMDFEKSVEYGTKRILDGKCQFFFITNCNHILYFCRVAVN